MADTRTLKLSLLADLTDFNKGLESAQGKIKKFGKSVDNAFKKTAVMAGAVGGAAFAFVKAGEEAATANARILNIADSMGLYGDQAQVVTDRLVELANKTALATGVDQNSIKLTQAKLLTFKELAATADEVGGSFDRATKAAIDMAAAGFGEAEMNAVQLGKALNDPIKGITALAKSGITFTKEEKNLIKAMVETSDASAAVALGIFDTEKAYNDFIKEQEKANKSYEESTKILTDDLTPAEKALFDQLRNTSDMIGAQDKVLGAIETQVGGTAEATANASDIMRIGLKQVSEEVGQALLPLFQQLVDFISKNLLPKIKDFSVFIKENQTLVKSLFIGLGILVATLGTLSLIIKAVNIATATFNGIIATATALQYLFNLAVSLNPIALLVIALGLLAAGFVLAYKKVEPFRDLIDDVINKIKQMGDAIKNSAFGKAIGSIVDKVTGGKAVGGMVSAGQAVRVGEMGSEVFIPGTSGQIIPNNKLGGGGTIININGVIDAESARRSIEKLLQNSARRTSPINLIGATL